MQGRAASTPHSRPGELTQPSGDELRALQQHAFDELSTAIGGIGHMQTAIAGRAFGALEAATRAYPPLALGTWSARQAHSVISQAVFSAIRGCTTAAGLLGDAALARRRRGDLPQLSTTAGGGAALAALNGLIGDELERQGSPLQQPIAVRVAGKVVPAQREALPEAFPHPTPRLAIFIHGLMETELAWRLGARGGDDTYGARLARELGFTPVYVRYNSGLHVSENGASLAELLEATVEAWPVEVEQIALVGHSMGGLVARSSCHQADQRGQDWVRQVRHVVSLGTPHMGAPLAQGVHYASAALHALPETRPFANLLRRRSAGIRDLRHGSLVDEDWRDRDPDALRAVAWREVPLLDCATHCFVSATISGSPSHPLGRLVGDMLVLHPSASGRSRSRRIPFRDEHGHHVGGTHHLALLNHPTVYRRLREWLDSSPRAAEPCAQRAR